MVGNKELEAGLKAMAEDFHLPGGGRKKLARLVVGHLWWFDAAEQRGMSWQDMIRAMTAAGVNGRGNKPITVGTLSSTVWRVRTKGEASGAREQERPGPTPTLPSGQTRKSTKNCGTGQPRQRIRKAPPENSDDDELSRPAPKWAVDRERSGRANKHVRAFMDRARAVRRRSADD